MSQGIYIGASEPRSGKSVVVLGIMEMLSGHIERIGFFRPLVLDDREPDSLTRLIIDRFRLDTPYQMMYGCTYDRAWDMLLHNREEELVKLILEKFRALTKNRDLVVCAGTDFTSPVSALEFDFNAHVANNLGCVCLPVVKGLGKDSREVLAAAQALLESLEERRCDPIAVIVNRVAQDMVDVVTSDLAQAMPAGIPAYVLPEITVLGMPTMGEIAWALRAEILYNPPGSASREVRNFKVAAMAVANYLNHLEEGSLVITPGDRSDVILATLMADAASTYPRVAGLVLTGGLKPAPSLKRLIDGLHASPVPIIAVETDTFMTARNVSAITSVLSPENPRKIAAALGIMESQVPSQQIRERLSMVRPTRVTPLMFEYDLIQRAKADRRRIVLPEGNEERILRAAEMLRMRDVVDLTLLGGPKEVQEKISALGLDLTGVDIIDPVGSDRRQAYADLYFELRKHKGISREMALDAMADVSYFGTMMVQHGEAHGMVSGSVHTTQHTIRPALEIIRTCPDCMLVSSIFFMCLADRVLVFGDCAVNPDPNPEQLADIAIRSADTARAFGIEPFVAMLSYSTGVSGKGEDVEKVCQATAMVRERRPDIPVEGPIQYDAAVDASVAKTKIPDSRVAGHATVFIFPDLNTGNNTYKAVQRSADAVAVGPVLQGLRKPVNDLSRGCTVTDIVNTIAITAIQAQHTTTGQ